MLRTFHSCAVVLFFVSTASAITPSFQGLGDLPGGQVFSQAYGISADGSTVVGLANGSGYNAANTSEAFRWTQAGGMVGLGDLPGSQLNANQRGSKSYSVSGDGSIIVGAGSSENAIPLEAFQWTNPGGMVGLGYLSAEPYSEAFAVSDDGLTIVGTGRSYEAFRWTQGTGMVSLQSLPPGIIGSGARAVSPDGSIVVGGIASATDDQAMRWTRGTGMVGLGYLPNPPTNKSVALGISADGLVTIGFSSSEAAGLNGTEAFRWTQADGMVGLGDLPGGMSGSIAFDTNSDGSIIVGEGSTPSGGSSAFIWDAINGMRPLQDVLLNDYGLGQSLAGWTLQSATSISDDGRTFAGSGLNPNGNTEAWVATVPEPSTFTLAAVIGALAPIRCRRIRKICRS